MMPAIMKAIPSVFFSAPVPVAAAAVDYPPQLLI
jgi:hypothetical protein